MCLLVLLAAFSAFWCLLVLFVRVKSFRKKNKIIKNKKFKTALITSFILLLNLSYYKHEFFNHYNLFQLSQSFSIITILFNYYDLFQLSQSFSIVTIFSIIIIFFNYHNLFQLSQSFSTITIFFNLFTACDTVFMKISQRTNSII